MTTSNEGVVGSCNNRIAVIATIVSSIFAFHNHGGKGVATSESSLSNARYALWDSDGGEGGAFTESLISNALYAIGDGHRGEGRAI